jgi:hypothetical protein
MLTAAVLSVSAWGQQTPGARSSSVQAGNGNNSQQQSDRTYDLQPGVDPDNRLLLPFTHHLLQDQQHFWTLPSRARKRD